MFSLAVFLEPMTRDTGWSLRSPQFAVLGPLGGGWIFDRFGGYAWLYIGSFALGMGAVAMALAFPPFPRRLQLQQSAP